MWKSESSQTEIYDSQGNDTGYDEIFYITDGEVYFHAYKKSDAEWLLQKLNSGDIKVRLS